jgi:hypothetical protein
MLPQRTWGWLGSSATTPIAGLRQQVKQQPEQQFAQ